MNINAISPVTNMYHRSFKSLEEAVYKKQIPDNVDDYEIVGTRIVDGMPASVTAGEVRHYQKIEAEKKAERADGSNKQAGDDLETPEAYYNRKLYSTEWTE